MILAKTAVLAALALVASPAFAAAAAQPRGEDALAAATWPALRAGPTAMVTASQV